MDCHTWNVPRDTCNDIVPRATLNVQRIIERATPTPMAETFEDLRVWQTARALTDAVYEHTKSGAFSKDFGLRDQIQRAAVSIMSNIAEGFESRTRSQFIHYLGQAKASAGEVRCQLYVAKDQEYLSEAEFSELYDQAEKVARQLYRLIQHLDDSDPASRVRELPSKYVA